MKGTLLLATCLLVSNLAAQTVFFNHITQEDGLRSGNVRAIVKDHQGFIWIGTEDGLHRYDGYEMKVYRNRQNDSSSISSNFILCLFEDSHKNLWAGTLGGGLCLYDRKNDSFRSFTQRNSTIPDNNVRTMTEGADHKLYIGTSRLTRATAHPASATVNFEDLALPGHNNEPTRVLAITPDLDGTLLVSIHPLGVFNFNSAGNTFSKHEISQWSNNVLGLFADKRRSVIWACTWNNGLIAYEPATKRHTLIKTTDTSPNQTGNPLLSSIAADATGNLWIASDFGLIRFPYNESPFAQYRLTTYLPDKRNQSGIHGNIIKAVYVDDQDKLWVGTYYEGVNVYDKWAMNFGTIASKAEQTQTPFSNISALQEDAKHRLWIGTDGGGLFLLKTELDQAHEYQLEHIEFCPGITKIKALKMDADQTLWIGTWGNGLFAYNTLTRQCKKIKEIEASDVGNEIMALNTTAPDYLWIGSFSNGVFRYSRKSKQLVHIKTSQDPKAAVDRIGTLYVDSLDNVWICREAGGLSLCKNGDTVSIPIVTDHISTTATVTSVLRDRHGMIWAGVANAGLVAYDPETKHSRLFTEKLGLANSMIQAIEEDRLGRLWLSSNNGISLFEKQNQSFANFTKANGLTASQFNKGSAVNTHNGRLAFGNIRGINYFNPEQFRRKDDNAPIVLTRLSVNNIEQITGGRNSALDQNITVTQSLELQHNQNSFSVQFAALDFNFTDLTRYAHILEGFDQNWQPAGTQRIISYTNLPPGEYTLKIRASNAPASKWFSNICTLRIDIVPAWWQTVWFKIAIAASVVILSYAVHRIRISYLLKQKTQLEKVVAERTRELTDTNEQLHNSIKEVNTINAQLSRQQDEIIEKNNEILTQNEELTAQNDHISQQQEKLLETQEQLKEINASLEKIVNDRTIKLQDTIHDLDKTVFELDRFVYSASHDLSAPLKSIRGLIEIIHMEKDPGNVYVYTEHIKNTVLKLETVIQSMVDYSRNVHIQVKPETFVLYDLVTEVISELTFSAINGQPVYLNNVRHDLLIQSDRARLKVVLHNLISNSIKYADKNKESNWIRVECEPNGQYWKLLITDNGIGIREEYLDKIFNMYFRATDMSKGSGLGLFIVKETLTKIGGRIKVQSDFGVQTRFELLLPKLRQA